MTEAAWKGRGLVKGVAEGPALISHKALSFLGDIDIRSGRVVGRSSDLYGEVVSGCVLVLPETRGSAGAWRFVYQLKVHATNPAALVLRDLPDPSVMQGAFLADLPILAAPEPAFWQMIAPGDLLRVDASSGWISKL